MKWLYKIFNSKGCKIAVTELVLITAKLLMRVDRPMEIVQHSKAENGPCLLFNMTRLTFLSCTFEVKLMTSLINHGVHLTHGLGERSR